MCVSEEDEEIALRYRPWPRAQAPAIESAREAEGYEDARQGERRQGNGYIKAVEICGKIGCVERLSCDEIKAKS